jgi:hypothetical protein
LDALDELIEALLCGHGTRRSGHDQTDETGDEDDR